MARVLAYTSPARGHLYPITETLLELRARGHAVHVRTLASQIGALREAGLAAEPVAPEIERLGLDDWRWATQQEALAGGLRTIGDRAVHEVPDLRAAIAQVRPDLLLVDITTVGATAVAESTGLPWAQWIPFFTHATLSPGSAPQVGFFPFALDPAGLEVIDAARRVAGLAPVTDPDALWRAPLYLYMTAEPFEHPGLDLPPAVRMVGPGTWEPPVEAPLWIDELEPPVVLVAVSSEFQGDDALVRASLEALGSEDLRMVVTTAAHDPLEFETPANARVVRWLPHGPVLRRAACVVCHGGMGITQKALAAGVPVCVVPYGRDQFEVAGRVAATDVGVALPRDQLDRGTLRGAVHSAIAKRAGAERLAAAFRRAGGAPAAATAVESLLSPEGHMSGTEQAGRA